MAKMVECGGGGGGGEAVPVAAFQKLCPRICKLLNSPVSEPILIATRGETRDLIGMEQLLEDMKSHGLQPDAHFVTDLISNKILKLFMIIDLLGEKILKSQHEV
ncbi:hypothetical protein JHK82_031490 [Glycine max]|nr:hypothetical protein JHK85_032143 [Glycine max]KAG4994749.1 hypothetical protein JHK86_031576 [Glycine max]KAG5124753.1 hypothetical protein JHK82_031490 [Glycine max]KAG5146169.1 hypothetical protein JHK84_031712 [Glycine max]